MPTREEELRRRLLTARLEAARAKEPKLDTAQAPADVTARAQPSPPKYELTPEQQEFRKKPKLERFARGAGQTLKEMVVNPVRTAWLTHPLAQEAQRKEVLEQETLPYERAAGGDPFATMGGIAADFGALIVPGGAAAGGVRGSQMISQLPRTLQSMVMGGAQGLTSAGAHQIQRLGQGRQIDPVGAAMETAISTALPVVAKAVQIGAKYTNKGLGKVAQEISGASEEALRKYGLGFNTKGAKELRSIAGDVDKVGSKLVNSLDDFERLVPQGKEIGEIVKQMGRIPLNKTVKVIKEEFEGIPLKKAQSGAVSKLNSLLDDIGGRRIQPSVLIKGGKKTIPAKRGALGESLKPKKEIKGSGYTVAEKETFESSMPGTQFKKKQQSLSDMVTWGESGSSALNNSLKKIRRTMTDELIDEAERIGRPDYVKLLKGYKEKSIIKDDFVDIIGNKKRSRQKRVESLLSNLHGRNKTHQKKVMENWGNLFGDDFVKDAKLMQLADQLGPEGVPTLLPRQFTGRSLMGPNIAAETLDAKNIIRATLGSTLAGLSSPQIASKMLGLADVSGKAAKSIGQKFNKPIKELGGMTLGDLLMQGARSAAFQPQGE